MKVYETNNFTLATDPMMLCPQTGAGTLSVALLIVLEHIKEKCGGAPVTISSGARCVEYNRLIGGGKRSHHIINGATGDFESDAADITVKGFTAKQLQLIVKELPYANLLGIGYYPKEGHVHVDVRGFAARWVG